MSSEVDLLRSLDDEPDTPSTVDIRRAIDSARRRRVRRGAGYAGAAAATAVAVAGVSVAGGLFAAGGEPTPSRVASAPSAKPVAAATPPTACTLERLPVPGNEPMALVGGGDGTGRYLVGRSYPRSGGYQAVIWHDGKPQNVMMPGNVEEDLLDVNSAGTAVGFSYTSTGGGKAVSVPYAYRNGKLTKLAARGSATAINDAGAIVGDDDAEHPVLWKSPTAKPAELPLPAGTKMAQARGIDEDGTVVGSLDFKRPYVWLPDGTHRELPMPELDGKKAAIAQAFDVRNGWVTGMASPDDLRAKGSKLSANSIASVRWNLRTGKVEVGAARQTPANTVNAQGWQVGTDGEGYPVLLADGERLVLPDLAKHRPDGLATIPNAVSDDGRTIAGQSDNAAGTIQPVIWHCR